MNAHRGIVNRLLWMQDAYGLTRARPGAAEDAVQLRRVGVGVLLAADGRRALVMARAGRPPDPAYLARADRDAGDHHAALRAVDAAGLPRGAARRELPSASRASSAAARRCRRSSQDRCFARLDVPSCTTSTGRPKPRSTSRTGRASAARPSDACRSADPIANTQLYVLDARLRAGADRRAGRAVHRRRAGRAWAISTARSSPPSGSSPDPFSSEPGARLYEPATWRAIFPTA